MHLLMEKEIEIEYCDCDIGKVQKIKSVILSMLIFRYDCISRNGCMRVSVSVKLYKGSFPKK